MELAPAPVNLSVGVLVSQSPPSVPPGAGEEVDDEQDPDEPALVDVVLEDVHATARRPAAQAIAPRRTRCRRWCGGPSKVAWLNGLLLSSRWTAGVGGTEAPATTRRDLTSLEQWIS